MSSEALPSDLVTDQPKTATVTDPPNILPIDSIGHLLVPFTHHAFDLLEDPALKIAGALGNEHLEWLDEDNLLGAEEKVLEYLRDVLRHEEEST
ncbi:hypothetical protein N7527_012086 [Penicillium freii]|nr:hypothetical protein N7527_012086 [Penicillium freii]